MRKTNEDKDDATASAEELGSTAALQTAFAQALGQELDRIGYPAAPTRTNQLSQDLDLGRMQAYRIGRGNTMPSLKSLLVLQRLGVSIDAVLAQLQDSPVHSDEVTLEILGAGIKAVPLPAYARTPFVVSNRDGHSALRLLKPGENPAADEVPVGGLRFTRPQPAVAVVEDEASTLAVLCEEIKQGFSVTGYKLGKALLKDPARLATYDALVLDWRLPDIEGAALIAAIRVHSHAPIVVTTGQARESQAISEVIRLPAVYFVAKPVDGNILRAILDSAIAKGGAAAPSTATAWATRSAPSNE